MPAAPIKTEAFLSSLSLFKELGEDEIRRLAAGTQAVRAERGEMLFHRGDAALGFHAIVYGQVKLFFTSPRGDEKVVDIAGGVVAARRARGRVATVAVNSFVFKQPVLIGDIVQFYAEVVRVGRTSITVDVQVFVERDPARRETVKVTEATLTYVATDGERRPRPVAAG